MRCGRLGQMGHGGKMPEIWDCRTTATEDTENAERQKKRHSLLRISVSRVSSIAPERMCNRAWTWRGLAFQRSSSAPGRRRGLAFLRRWDVQRGRKEQKGRAQAGAFTRSNYAESQGDHRALAHSNYAKSQGDHHVLALGTTPTLPADPRLCSLWHEDCIPCVTDPLCGGNLANGWTAA